MESHFLHLLSPQICPSQSVAQSLFEAVDNRNMEEVSSCLEKKDAFKCFGFFFRFFFFFF